MGSTISTSNPTAFQDSVLGSNLPHVPGPRDERIEITSNNTVHPFQWTCQLQIETQKGNHYVANGFKISVQPLLYNQVILTTAHSLFVDGAYAKKITVLFPGEKEQVAYTKQLWAPSEFVENGDPEHNYGVILLPGNSQDGIEWTTLLSDKELVGRPLSTCGYPSDKPKGTLWTVADGVEKVTSSVIYFMQNSASTGSGSPVFTWHRGSWVALGIQSYCEVFNNVVRLTSEVLRKILKGIGYLISYMIESKALSNVYLRAEPPIEGGIVNCYYGACTPFDVYPIEMRGTGRYNVHTIAPSSAKGTWLHVVGASNSEAMELTCKDGSGLQTHYIIHQNDDGSVSIESAALPGSYIHTETTSSSCLQQGIANCRFVSEKTSNEHHFILHLQEK